jgi:hypothetical protein
MLMESRSCSLEIPAFPMIICERSNVDNRTRRTSSMAHVIRQCAPSEGSHRNKIPLNETEKLAQRIGPSEALRDVTVDLMDISIIIRTGMDIDGIGALRLVCAQTKYGNPSTHMKRSNVIDSQQLHRLLARRLGRNRVKTDHVAFGVGDNRDGAVLTSRKLRSHDPAAGGRHPGLLDRAVVAREVDHRATGPRLGIRQLD